MIDIPIPPTINACLNLTAGIFLVVGRIRIARKDIPGHRTAMIRAGIASALFFVGYIAFHTWRVYVTGEATTEYPRVGALRTIYLTILITHSFLAVPLFAWFVPRTFFLALKGRFDEHRRIARITFPIWAYVSITGVVVYLMLYPFRPQALPG